MPDVGDAVGDDEEVYQLKLAVGIGFGHFGVDGIEYLLLSDGEGLSFGEIHRDCVDEHHLCTVFHGQCFGAEGPSGADKEVALHAEVFGFAEGDFKGIEPFVAEPCERGNADTVAPFGGELYGIDFHTANTRIV